MTLTLNSCGQRFVGDHIGNYADGDLVLLGPNLPHTWSSLEKIATDEPHIALVMWFHPDWAQSLTKILNELRPVAQMLDRASRGIHFSVNTAHSVQPMIIDLFDRPPAQRLVGLIAVLTELATDEEATVLASSSRTNEHVSSSDQSRIDRVLAHIHGHYADQLTINELAGVAALSPSGVHRLFRRHTRLSLMEYIARLRIGQACALLSGAQSPIAHIADTVGYGSLAHFNRQFRSLKNMTPRDYRKQFHQN